MVADAGAQRLVLIVSPGKESVAAYFDADPELEAQLHGRGKSALLAKVRRASELISAQVAVQDKPLGLGHAVGCAEPVLTDADEAVAVLLRQKLAAGQSWVGSLHDEIQPGARRHG